MLRRLGHFKECNSAYLISKRTSEKGAGISYFVLMSLSKSEVLESHKLRYKSKMSPFPVRSHLVGPGWYVRITVDLRGGPAITWRAPERSISL